jgi:hypothetical protein
VVALANVPAPLCVHNIVPLLELAPLTVAVPFTQIDWLPPAAAVGCWFVVTVGVILIWAVHPVDITVAKTLNVVLAAVNGPVGKLIVPPVPVTGPPIRLLSALSLNW